MSLEYRHPDSFVNRLADWFASEHIGVPIHSLGTRLRYARKHRKMSQGTLAKGAGITQPSVSELESGETKEITGPTLIAICQVLSVRPEWLVKATGPMEPHPAEGLTEDELELLSLYRAATGRWKVAIKHMAKLRGDNRQDEAADTMNYVLAKIAADPVGDERLGTNWTRPDKKQ